MMRWMLAWWTRRAAPARPALHRWCHAQYSAPCDPMTKLDLANLDNGVGMMPKREARDTRDAVTVFVDGYGT